jgi:hypothetical protein
MKLQPKLQVKQKPDLQSATKQTPWPLACKRTIRTELPPLVGEVHANFCWYRGVAWLAQWVRTAVNLGFLYWSRYFFISAAPFILKRLSRPVPDPLLLKKSGTAGNRTWGLWICSQERCPLDHRDGHRVQHDSVMQCRDEECRAGDEYKAPDVQPVMSSFVTINASWLNDAKEK